MLKSKLLLMFVLLALLFSIVPEALAQGPPPGRPDPTAVRALVEELASAGDNADELWAELPPETQKAVLEYVRVARFTTKVTTGSDGMTPQSNGCTWAQLERIGTNLYGQEVAGYFQKIDWCYDGSKITSKSRIRWGEVYIPGWQFVGHIGNSEQGGVNQWSYRAWTQGEFRLCLSGVGCIQYWYPWIDMTVYGNGTWTGNAGG